MRTNPKRIRRWSIATLGFGFLISSIVVAEGLGGVFSGALGRRRPLFESLMGAREMAHAVDTQVQNARDFYPDFLVGGNFASALSYAFYGHALPYYTIGDKYNAKYGLVEVLRPIEIGPNFGALHRGENALLVVEEHTKPRKAAHRRLETLQELKPYFRSVRAGGVIDIRRYSRTVKRYQTYNCTGLTSTPEAWTSAGEKPKPR